MLADIGSLAANAGLSAHARYLKMYDLIEERNEHMARLFDNPQRSTALMQLALMCRSGLVSAEELAQFSEATSYAQIWCMS